MIDIIEERKGKNLIRGDKSLEGDLISILRQNYIDNLAVKLQKFLQERNFSIEEAAGHININELNYEQIKEHYRQTLSNSEIEPLVSYVKNKSGIIKENISPSTNFNLEGNSTS
jgi:hypothetical protein